MQIVMRKEKTIILGDIKKGETITKEYELRIEKGTTIKEIEQTSGATEEKNYEEVNEYPGDKDISNIVRVSANNMSGEIKSESYTLKNIKKVICKLSMFLILMKK